MCLPLRDLKYKLGDGGFTRVLDLTAEAQNPLLHVDVVASSGPHEERRTRAGWCGTVRPLFLSPPPSPALPRARSLAVSRLIMSLIMSLVMSLGELDR